MAKRCIYIAVVILLFISYSKAQNSYPVNGFYVSTEGDTVHGNLENKKQMYLILRDTSGNKKTFTPSKIRSFTIDHNEYTSAFLKNIGKKRFVKVLVKGQYSLFLYEDPAYYVTTDVLYAMTDHPVASYSMFNSGYYLSIQGDEEFYSIPSTNKLITEFFERHALSLPKLITGNCNDFLLCLPEIVDKLNFDLNTH